MASMWSRQHTTTFGIDRISFFSMNLQEGFVALRDWGPRRSLGIDEVLGEIQESPDWGVRYAGKGRTYELYPRSPAAKTCVRHFRRSQEERARRRAAARQAAAREAADREAARERYRAGEERAAWFLRAGFKALAADVKSGCIAV